MEGEDLGRIAGHCCTSYSAAAAEVDDVEAVEYEARRMD